MKYEIKEEKERLFYGYSEVVDLNSNENTPFAEIWNKSSKEFDMKYFDPNGSCIGLESYPYNFMELRQFTYGALYPIHSTEGLESKKLRKLEAGKYIRFETTFEDLVKGFIPKVYQYIKENNIPVDYEFDYEEYPPEFLPQNPKSIVYVCMKYKG